MLVFGGGAFTSRSSGPGPWGPACRCPPRTRVSLLPDVALGPRLPVPAPPPPVPGCRLSPMWPWAQAARLWSLLLRAGPPPQSSRTLTAQ